ncbi:MAG: ribonuclease HI family protein [Chloroflexi bacterium]|nr:ribonuclease HI family protein [Chloroflexota bacterium]
MYTLRFDGLFREAPGAQNSGEHAGLMCYGWIISKEGAVVARGHGAVARGRDATSNVAEYLALIEGLDALRDLNTGTEAVQVFGDAKSVIEQMQGVAAVNSASIIPLHRRAVELASQHQIVSWCWTPRRHNRAADSLTRRAMRQVRQDEDEYRQVMQALLESGEKRRRTRKFLQLMDLRVYQPVLAEQ